MKKADLIYAHFLLNRQYIVKNRNDNVIVMTNNVMFKEELYGAEKFALKIINYLSNQYQIHLFQPCDIDVNNVVTHQAQICIETNYICNVCKEIYQIKPKLIFCNAGDGIQILFWNLISHLTHVPMVVLMHNEPQYMINTMTISMKTEHRKLFPNMSDKELFEIVIQDVYKVIVLDKHYKLYNNMEVISNCIVLPNYNLSDDREYLLYVGRINSRIKRTNLLLDIVTDEKLTVIGKSYLMDGFIDMIKYPHIKYDGYVTNVEEYYKKAIMLVVPSILEGFPTVILEALSFGVPIVVMDDCIVLKKFVEENHVGFVANKNNLKEIINYKPSLQIRQHCMNVAKQYDINIVLPKIVKIIEDAI